MRFPPSPFSSLARNSEVPDRAMVPRFDMRDSLVIPRPESAQSSFRISASSPSCRRPRGVAGSAPGTVRAPTSDNDTSTGRVGDDRNIQVGCSREEGGVGERQQADFLERVVRVGHWCLVTCIRALQQAKEADKLTQLAYEHGSVGVEAVDDRRHQARDVALFPALVSCSSEASVKKCSPGTERSRRQHRSWPHAPR